MTIVAGFKCYEGVVLCADTQETIAELSKRNVPKLIFEPKDQYGKTKALNNDDLAVAFCGAANNGPFVDKLVENAWEDAQIGTTMDEVCTIIQTSIERTYKKYGEIYQTGYCPSADLIYGVKMFGSSKLFSASGPVVNEQKRYSTGGAGYYMADFLASRMYTDHLSLRQSTILAAYILFQAKEHVDGCGGDSQIAILRDRGVSGPVDWIRLESINKLLSYSDSKLSEMLLSSADLAIDGNDFLQSMQGVAGHIQAQRDLEENNYRQLRRLSKQVFVRYPDKTHIDEFGLPMQSDTQTSEDQQ